MTQERHAELAIHPIAEADEHLDLHQRGRMVRRAKWLAVLVLVALGAGGAWRLTVRTADAKALADETAANAKQYVKVATPRRAATGPTLQLPGTLQGYVQAPIASRASGYLKRWVPDIGTRVAKGALLAEIESPEIDKQLAQAIAAREQAAQAMGLAESTVSRWEGLRGKDVVSQQDLDEKRSGLAQARANLAAADANVDRLRQLEGFKRIVAPFGGVVVRRNVDTGDLIDPSRPLFLLSQTDPLRVYVNVPQAYSQLVKPGLAVTVQQAELRSRKFTGEVVRTSGAIDTATRTLQVEVSLPNPDGVLMPGAYVQVSVPLPTATSLVAPTNTLLLRAEGALVGVVAADGRVSLRKVAVGRNFGPEIELLEGVTETDRLVLNPPDWLADGRVVAVAPSDPPKGGGAAKGGEAAKGAEAAKDAPAAKGGAPGRDGAAPKDRP
ncbi:MAG: efflux RND transporter periplasmic adaptor subunit [Burkholderiales bacterium]